MKNIDLKNVKRGTVIRGLLMLLVIVNYILASIGVNPINIEGSTIAEISTVLLTVGTFVLSYWKNNSFTKAAQAADAKLTEVKEEAKCQ